MEDKLNSSRDFDGQNFWRVLTPKLAARMPKRNAVKPSSKNTLSKKVTNLKDINQQLETKIIELDEYKTKFEKLKQLFDDHISCEICLDETKPRDTILFPCLHMLYCWDCVSSTDTCPYCRVKISGRLQCLIKK
jgi:hypothetical protein